MKPGASLASWFGAMFIAVSLPPALSGQPAAAAILFGVGTVGTVVGRIFNRGARAEFSLSPTGGDVRVKGAALPPVKFKIGPGSRAKVIFELASDLELDVDALHVTVPIAVHTLVLHTEGEGTVELHPFGVEADARAACDVLNGYLEMTAMHRAVGAESEAGGCAT